MAGSNKRRPLRSHSNPKVQSVIELAPVRKDEEREYPVPSLWRRKLREIVAALHERNYALDGIADVEQPGNDTSTLIAEVIQDYGCTITVLPDESWETSVCSWQVTYWDVLVDLFTVEEGRSDLVLQVNVVEQADRFLFKVHLVYVP
ncbi:MAG: hypothetical protein WC729_00630 [Sphingomonas sp.]|jgi:hypothetical protein|uniref:DUF7668 domain-containing protein n=1 Tax=Sphingomonas sp. TaxID=28214 RepID=UPI003569E345